MLLLDVNVLVYVARSDSPRHRDYKEWLEGHLARREPVGLSGVVLGGVLRILTHPSIFLPPTPPDVAMAFVESLRGRHVCVSIEPGPRHWEIFTDLCARVGARGNTIPDAYLAALSIEHGCEWITADRGFARFPELRWRHPLE